MSSARDEILGRVRLALADVPAPAPAARDYRRAGSSGLSADELRDRFVERVEDYRARVHRAAADEVAGVIAGVLGDAAPVVVPDGFPAEFLPDVVIAREPLEVSDLDVAGAVLTTCAVAVAETGTIVLDAGPGQGRRALTLVPDHHVCVVRADQILAAVPDAIGTLDPTRPLTFVSGPSATSDIELDRVEGVHGPRRLDVVVVG